MSASLTFIIPVRHPDNARNWPELKRNLSQTIKSIAAQTHAGWKCVIVANTGADLPALSEKFEICHVDFPPNDLHEQGGADKESFYEAIRLDKGRRILAGMLQSRDSDYFMVVDDDDFVHNGLVEFIGRHKGMNGWFFQNGHVWADGGNLVYRHPQFHKFCGTSHIIRSDLFGLPDRFELATDEYIKRMLGSHIFIQEHLAQNGTPLSPLPFSGAVYRIGHSGAHSKSAGLLRTFVLKKKNLKNPASLLSTLFRIRFLNTSIRQQFFG